MTFDKYILLVDDDEDELEIFTDALKKLRFPFSFFCERVSTVDDAMVFLKKIKPDFIFLDFNMPVKSGLDGLEQIKRISQYAGIPIILYSGFIDEEIDKKAMEMGAAACLRKPYHTRTLTYKLNTLLQ